MQFILKAFQEVEGLGAASGLVYQHPRLYLISDYSSYLYCYELEQGQLNKIALFADSRDFIPKPEKFDFEAILEYDNALLLLGSGSTPRRNALVRHDLSDSKANQGSSGVTRQYDLSALYEKFRQTAQLNDDELNIEGAIYHQSQWLLFQRGNGTQAQNGIFIVQGNIVQDLILSGDVRPDGSIQPNNIVQAIEFVPLQLPVVNQVSSGFTDAILVGETIYFLATAENSSSTYDDGEVLGSYIGYMDLNTKTIQDVQLISTCHKFEGLALYQQTPHKLEFLLCEDNDTEQLSTTIYKLTLAQD
ncbi:DUF6929 family protein [Alkanindiges illinoisensis]|uniref:DUF6929 family protein n=1 Tax=Alkanindiges illinoisensis TaxID=197183 RepID=UPI0005538187|nr:hypothetical protein [Alkanindiges illinoisensis]